MKLTSSVFNHEENIPSKYTCDGQNINPPLRLEDIPDEAKSLALIMEDPDVPQDLREDGMWDHWVVFNMPPNMREIEEGKEPEGIAGIGTNGNQGYFGPCPPDREHRYYFKLFALDTVLDLPEKSTKQDLENEMSGHIVDQAVLMGRYERGQ